MGWDVGDVNLHQKSWNLTFFLKSPHAEDFEGIAIPWGIRGFAACGSPFFYPVISAERTVGMFWLPGRSCRLDYSATRVSSSPIRGSESDALAIRILRR